MINVPVEVKDALREGTYKKNYRFVVLNEDGTASDVGTIDNDNLVSESVSIDERMCSGDTLKFGLCEGSSLEFQYFDKPNITGKRVQAFVDVEYGADEPYTIPMGFFDVKKCSRQASTGIIKATCYNKLQSDYLDGKANEVLASLYTYDAVLTAMDIQSGLLSQYKIDTVVRDRVPIGDLFDTYYLDLGTFHLTSNYGIDSFINPCVAPFATNGFGLVLIGASTEGEDVGRLEAPRGTLPGVAYSLNNWLKEVIDGAQLDVSFDTLFSRLINGYYEFDYTSLLYARRRTRNPSLDSGVCNDVVHDYQVSQGQIPTINSLQNTWVYGYANFDFTSISAIGIYQLGTEPESCSIWLDCTSKTSYNKSTGVANNQYEYYTDAQQTKAISTGQSLLFSDGTRWADDPGSWTDALIQLYDYPNGGFDLTVVGKISEIPDFTLREMTTATYESLCQFGQLSRLTDLFSGVELNHSRLYPADSLYPATDLYPDGAAASGFKSMYSKLWADEGNIHKWRDLIITYKGLNADQQEEDFTLQRTVNTDGTDDYNMSDNWLFRNLVWTAEQVAEYAEAMVAKMQDITWFPFEMWCAGLPYLETGDEIEIPLNGESYTSYVLQRQLKGIQNLQDTYINGTLDIF